MHAYRRQYRLSAVTAASAAEVALAEAAKGHLAQVEWPERDVDEVLWRPRADSWSSTA